MLKKFNSCRYSFVFSIASAFVRHSCLIYLAEVQGDSRELAELTICQKYAFKYM